MDNEASLQEPTAQSNVDAAAIEAANVETATLQLPTCRVPRASAEALFEIIIAVMWSDGELVETEVIRGRAAADVLQIRPRGGGAFAAIAAGPLPFPELGFEHLDEAQTAAAYAAAEWISLSNETPSPRRTRFLQALQTRMRIDDAQAGALRDLAQTIDGSVGDPHQAVAALLTKLDAATLS